jgi:hypothetical protein
MNCTVFRPIHTQSGKLGKPVSIPHKGQEKEKACRGFAPDGLVCSVIRRMWTAYFRFRQA